MNRVDAWRMRIKVGCHTFRATGITAYLEAGGTLENAQAMAAHGFVKILEFCNKRQSRC